MVHADELYKAEELSLNIRNLTKEDISDADRIFRLAFGTWNGLPEPAEFGGDANFCLTRWLADKTAAMGAEIDGELVGSNFAAIWGSVGFFGPLTVLPKYWEKGIAQQLLQVTMKYFDERGVRHAGIFTHPDSPKHLSLYQKFGFWPRFLTAMMSMPIQTKTFPSAAMLYSQTKNSDHQNLLEECRSLTHSIFEGLDLEVEINTVKNHGLGETVLLRDGKKLSGLAVCHCGTNTEAGSDNCYIKFGAVAPGPNAPENFYRLLDACEAMGAEKGMLHLKAGVNTARHKAYEIMIKRGFRIDMLGVSMQRPNEPGYNLPEVYVCDDWR